MRPRRLALAAAVTAVTAVTAVGAGPAPVTAPDPRAEVVRPLAGTQADSGVSILSVGEDLLIAGYTSAAGEDAGLLLRVSATGDEIWRAALPCGGDGAVWSIQPLGDGTFAGAGWTKSAAGDLDAMLVRFDAAGKVIWQTAYAGPLKERLWSLQVDRRGLLAAGEAAAPDGTSQGLVIRTDLDGREIFRRTTGSAPSERDFSVQALDDGGYVLAGMSGSGPREGPGYDARITRYGASGELIWSRAWGGAGYDVAHDVHRKDDGGFLVTGYTAAGDSRGTDVFLLDLSPAGEIVWSRTYGGPRDDRAVHLALLPDGGAAIAGYSQSESGDWDIVLRVTAEGGAESWSRRFGGRGNELGRSVLAGPGGSLTVLGHSQSYGPLERILLVRLGA
ncbi:MAG TPA: hypothetical protein VE404_00710 [Verrucomicrobiae bacterium]|nr:hypothetical protein [Verrucomicrobiae bacterium]